MLKEIIVAGSGGQGVLLVGEVIAIASIDKGRYATWLPSYGPEMRGGTANCAVVVSTDEIGSPMVEEPSILICFNQPSLLRFGPTVLSNGLIIVNDDAIKEYYQLNEGVNIIKINAQKIAIKLGDIRMVNMVMIGALLKESGLFDIEEAAKALTQIWGNEKTQKIISINQKAIQAGMDAIL